MGSAPPSDDEILQAFRLIDQRLATGTASPLLVPFRDRLVGELVGDSKRVSRTLADGFELITYAGGSRTVTSRAAIVDSVQRLGQARGSLLIWVEFDDLVVEGQTLAAHGALQTLCTASVAAQRGQEGLRAGDLCQQTAPFALFLTFQDELMIDEVFYTGAAPLEVTVFQDTSMPDISRLQQLAAR